MNNGTEFFRLLVVTAAGIVVAATAFADPTDFEDKKIPTNTIELAEDGELGGRIARFDGIVSGQGQRLIVKGLDVMSPLVVRVLAKDIAQPVDVSLHRYFWGRPDAEGSTGSAGDWEYRGRAHDEMGIALSASKSTPVFAFLWQGTAVPAAVAPTVVIDTDRNPTETGESGGISVVTIAIVGLLFVIAVLLALQLLRRRPSAAAMILAAALLTLTFPDSPVLAQSSGSSPPNPFADDQTPPGDEYKPEDSPDKPDSASADDVPNPFADDQTPPGDEYKPEDSPDKPGDSSSQTPADNAQGSKLKPDPNSGQPNEQGNKLKPDPDSDQPNGQGNKLKPDPNSDKPNEQGNKLKPDPDSDKPNEQGNKLKPDPDSDKPNEQGNKLKPDPDSDEPNEQGSKLEPEEARLGDSDSNPDSSESGDSTTAGESGTGGDSAGGDRSFEGRLVAAYDELRALNGEIAANASRISRLEFLINQDREAVPAPGDGAPPISFSCADDDICQQCLARANTELSNLLVNLDKLRIIYVNYIRYRDYMVGLGDSISGFHQLEQAAWYRVKLQIEQSTVNLQSAYDSKFDEYKGRLSQTMANLSACGAHSGDPTFTRESILFENYVKAKYAREQ